MDKKVETFLNELRNLNNYKNKLIELEDKLDTLFYDLTGVKAVRYDLVKGMSDYQQIELIKLGKIDEYNIQKEKIEKEITRLMGNISYIESVLNKMDSNIREACIEIYCQKRKYRETCKEHGYSKTGMEYVIKKTILKVL